MNEMSTFKRRKEQAFGSLFFIWLISTFFSFYPNAFSSIHLEKVIQDFVLETKKIEIPGYPYAFNAGIIKWQNAWLMSFRVIPNPKDPFCSFIGLVWLNQDFHPIGEPQILNLREFSLIPSRTEDARLIAVKNQLWIIYQDNLEPKITRGGFRMYGAELCYDGHKFSVKTPIRFSPFEGENPNIREKNWVPFVYGDQLLFAYSLTPHRIFFPQLEIGECKTLFTTSASLLWKWGILRGGTPALRMNNRRYLAFFHSSTKMATVHSKEKTIPHYFIGAYTFSADPPFELMQISPKPIIGKNFYEGKAYSPYWHPIQVIFPCGFIFDNQYIWLTYGRQDHEIWVVKLDKEGLLQSLIPVHKL